MINKIRDIINKNRLYSCMAVFIILIQAAALMTGNSEDISEEKRSLSSDELKEQMELRQEAFRQIIKKDQRLAANMGFLSLFMIIIFITGIVFLADYINKRKRYNIELIPKTLDAPPPLWSPGDVLKVIILILFFSQIFFIFAAFLDKIFYNRSMDKRSGIIASTVFTDILIFMLVLKVVMEKYRQSIAALGISFKSFLRNIGIALYSYIGFLPVLAVIFVTILTAAKVFNYSPPPQPIYELIFEEKRVFLLLMISIMISMVGPFIEEVFFRGFLYAALRRRLSASLSIFISAFFFSLLHANLLGFFPILALGMFLAYLREKTNSLIPSIAVHILHNTALTCMMFFVREITSKTI
ncbi:MAG: CPBP family intramembrane glutamic endopeptidase [Candidatus Omnitrophota bacterium]